MSGTFSLYLTHILCTVFRKHREKYAPDFISIKYLTEAKLLFYRKTAKIVVE